MLKYVSCETEGRFFYNDIKHKEINLISNNIQVEMQL